MTDETQTTDPLTLATLVARQAPSFLNTQPWRWRRDADVAELWLDRDRLLPGVDPDGRLATMSCGVALHHAVTALHAIGRAGAVQRVTDGERPGLVATVRPGARSAPDRNAFAAVAGRRTDRRPFADVPPAPTDLDAMRAAAERHGAHLWFLAPRQVPAFARSLAEARLREHVGAQSAAELADWTARPPQNGDGVLPRAAGDADEFGFSRSPWMALGESTAGSTVYAIVFTDGDVAADWLTAGEALSDVWLTLTARGLAASPFSEVVEVPEARAGMRQLIGGAGHPMIALRIGFPGDPAAPPPPTARRPIADVVGESSRRAPGSSR